MNALPLHLFEGQRAESVIDHGGDGHHYHLCNSRPNRRFSYLRCVHHDSMNYQRNGTAKALLHANVLYHMQPHSHEANVMAPAVQELRRAVTRRVQMGDQTSFGEILEQEGQRFPFEVRAQVPLVSITSRLNNIRRSIGPPVPRSLGVLGACLLLPQYEYLTKCINSADNMYAGMCGNMPDGTLSLVFICPEMKRFMESRTTVFCDGKERKKFRKPKVQQIFSIVALWRFHIIPMLRALMLNKSERAYLVLLSYIKHLMPDFQPRLIMCDFEEAQFNAYSQLFPRARVEGCWWHFASAIFRHANTTGLYHLVKAQPVVASIVRAASALPLLASEDIEEGLVDLGEEALQTGWMPELREFFEYLYTERIPKADILSVKGCISRTNNPSESANRGFNKEVKVSKPSCFTVLSAFVRVNDTAITDLRTLAEGRRASRARRLSVRINDIRIQNLTEDLQNGDLTRLQFLHRASRGMQNVFNRAFH